MRHISAVSNSLGDSGPLGGYHTPNTDSDSDEAHAYKALGGSAKKELLTNQRKQ